MQPEELHEEVNSDFIPAIDMQKQDHSTSTDTESGSDGSESDPSSREFLEARGRNHEDETKESRDIPMDEVFNKSDSSSFGFSLMFTNKESGTHEVESDSSSLMFLEAQGRNHEDKTEESHDIPMNELFDKADSSSSLFLEALGRNREEETEESHEITMDGLFYQSDSSSVMLFEPKGRNLEEEIEESHDITMDELFNQSDSSSLMFLEAQGRNPEEETEESHDISMDELFDVSNSSSFEFSSSFTDTESGSDEDESDSSSFEFLEAQGRNREEENENEESRNIPMDEVSCRLHPYICNFVESKHQIDRCVICQFEYEEGEAVVTLIQCEHPYHRDCISKWLRKKKVCPICSSDVSSTPRMP